MTRAGRAAAPTTEPLGDHSPLRELAVQVGRLWWVPLVAGLLSLGLGLAVLASDWTVKALVVVTGIAMVVQGLSVAFSPSYASHARGEQVVAGVLEVLGGIVLVAWPGPTLLVLAVLAGAWLTLSGAFHVVACVARRRDMARWGLGAAIGVVELLLGLWVMRRPEVTLTLVVTVIGLWLAITGVMLCVQAFEIRHAAKEIAEAPAPPTIDLRDSRPAEAAGSTAARTTTTVPRRHPDEPV